eukprot:1761669-Heterocapsa_arctica.AAC.1
MRYQRHSKLPPQDGVHGGHGGQHLHSRGLARHFQRAPDRSPWNKSILGLGTIFEQHGFPELEDLPEM